MRFIDRLTLDDVSAKVWWPFAMVLLVLLVLTFPGEHRAIDARHRATAAADAALTARVIAPALGTVPPGPIGGSTGSDLAQKVRDEILVNDARIRAVRIWSSSDHELLWSSTAGEPLGGAQALNDQDIDHAVAAAGAGVPVIDHRTPENAPSPTLFYAYTAFGAKPLVTQFDYLDAQLTSDVRAAWLGYQIVLALGFLLALTFALLSMREPKARIGTGVAFYPESVPSYLTVMDADRAVTIEQAGDRIKERVAGLQQRLDESEAAKLRAEGQLQQALAALNTPGHRMPVPAPTAPAPTTPVAVPEPQPVIEAAPEPEPVAEAVPEPEPTAQPAPAVAKVPEPAAAPAPRPAEAPKPKRGVRRKPATAPRTAPEAPEPVGAPAPAPAPPVVIPEARPAVAEPEPAAPAASTAQEASGETSPEVVVVPEPQPAERSASEEGSPSALLDRLVEPVGSHPTADDASDLRARLARTAAIKKPGSKERRELDEQQHRS